VENRQRMITPQALNEFATPTVAKQAGIVNRFSGTVSESEIR
jgi:hypothetical protein